MRIIKATPTNIQETATPHLSLYGGLPSATKQKREKYQNEHKSYKSIKADNLLGIFFHDS